MAWAALRLATRGADVAEPADVWPDGRWHYQVQSLPDERGRDLARLISLGYTAGSVEAGASSGITAHDRERAQPGLNLYVSGHAPEAILMDMDGAVLHRWALPYEQAFGQAPEGAEVGYFRRAALQPDGELVVIYQGGGMVRLDRDSKPLWRHDDAFFNDFFIASDGTVYGLTKRARKLPELSGEALVLEDSILVLPPPGDPSSEPRSISLLQALLRRSGPAALGEGKPEGDVLHSNTLEVFDGSLAGASPLFAAGRALVSLREVHTLGIVDLESGELVWTQRGPWRMQHQPTPLADGRLLLFDNRGRSGQSRVVEIDPSNGALLWEYAGPPSRPLRSPEGGSVQRLGGGNTLITESEQGRALEVTREGVVVWEFVSPHRAGPRQELVATLFEVIRYPLDHARWLTPASAL